MNNPIPSPDPLAPNAELVAVASTMEAVVHDRFSNVGAFFGLLFRAFAENLTQDQLTAIRDHGISAAAHLLLAYNCARPAGEATIQALLESGHLEAIQVINKQLDSVSKSMGQALTGFETMDELKVVIGMRCADIAKAMGEV